MHLGDTLVHPSSASRSVSLKGMMIFGGLVPLERVDTLKGIAFKAETHPFTMWQSQDRMEGGKGRDHDDLHASVSFACMKHVVSAANPS